MERDCCGPVAGTKRRPEGADKGSNHGGCCISGSGVVGRGGERKGGPGARGVPGKGMAAVSLVLDSCLSIALAWALLPRVPTLRPSATHYMASVPPVALQVLVMALVLLFLRGIEVWVLRGSLGLRLLGCQVRERHTLARASGMQALATFLLGEHKGCVVVRAQAERGDLKKP